MANRKINASNVIKLSATTTTLSLGVGASGSYLLAAMYPTQHVSTIACMVWGWVIPHSWILLAAVDSLREELGFKPPIRIAGHFANRALGRKIPVNSGDKQTNIFMKAIPVGLLPAQSISDSTTVELETISVDYQGGNHTITLPELETFVYSSYRRQSQSKAPFSRLYWTRERRPRLQVLQYSILMSILSSVPGLVIDRSQGRSGRLAIEPREALNLIKEII